jgi:hypothetical protein
LIFGDENNIKPGETYLRYEKHLAALRKYQVMYKTEEPGMFEMR